MAESKTLNASFHASPGSGDILNGIGSVKKKGDRTRRAWSSREEEVLVMALKDLVANGWKSDNGFRAGYLCRVEEMMKREFPKTDLKVTPHIISKISAWKKSYYSLVGILGRSGVGFNINGNYKIDCDNDQWEQIVKVDGNARFMRHKSWPFWEDWKEVFGKDRATGEAAEDIFEVYKDLFTEPKEGNVGMGSEFDVSLEDLFTNEPQPQPVLPEEVPTESTGQSAHASKGPKNSGKKRKAVDSTFALIELLGKMHEDTNVRLEKLTNRIGYEFDVSKSRKEVFEILGTMPGLSLAQQLDAAEVIMDKVQSLDLFMCLPDVARQAYVLRVLEKNHNH